MHTRRNTVVAILLPLLSHSLFTDIDDGVEIAIISLRSIAGLLRTMRRYIAGLLRAMRSAIAHNEIHTPTTEKARWG